MRFPLLVLSLFSLTLATPTPVQKKDENRDHPTPSLPFTLAAFQSPGSNPICGIRVSASGGDFLVNSANQKPSTSCGNGGYTCPPGNATVLWVDRYGQVWLDSKEPQQVYFNAQTGALQYLTSVSNPPNTFAAGALVYGFQHLGQGTTVSQPIPNEPSQYQNPGPGSFNFINPINTDWLLCPRQGSGYQVMIGVGGSENWDACVGGVNLVALDYAGGSPAAGAYL